MPALSTIPLAPSPKRSPRAFTLIEILVTVAIIIILVAITIGVGSQVKAGASQRSTHVTLKTLEGLMKDYLAAGNPEPAACADPADETAWLAALRANPEYAKKLSNLPTDSTNSTILDAFANPIRYLPYNSVYGAATPGTNTTKKEGYFWSPGPDKQPNTSDDLFSSDP